MVAWGGAGEARTVVDKRMIISVVAKILAVSSVIVTLLREVGRVSERLFWLRIRDVQPAQVYKAGKEEIKAERLLAGDGPVYS